MGVTFIHTQEKTVIFYMLKLLLYEAGTKILPICNFFWQLPTYAYGRLTLAEQQPVGRWARTREYETMKTNFIVKTIKSDHYA